MMDANQQTDDRQEAADWQECESGTLAAYSARNRAGRLSKQVRSIATTVAACSLIAVGCFLGIQSLGWLGPQPVGGLACDEVMRQMDEYFAKELDHGYRVRVVSHLEHCSTCNEKYQARAIELSQPLFALQPVSHPATHPLLTFGIAVAHR